MRRTQLVLAIVAVMVAVLVAFAAPALANDGVRGNSFNGHHGNNNNDHDFFDHHNDCCDNDANLIFVSDNGFDDFEFGDDDFEVDDIGFFNNFGFLGCWEWDDDEWDWEC